MRRLDVLLVDDDHEVLGPTADLLRTRHDVRVANGLREAVDQLVRRVPDAIVCDFDLPPYRGDVLLGLVAREHPEVRRILYTASPLPDEGVRFDCAHSVLVKPATANALFAAVSGEE
jgi:DNA-binding NtrC family response regulator